MCFYSLIFFVVNIAGTRIGQASECFVYWKDPMTNDTWGLNFTSPIDAKQFRECCVSNIIQDRKTFYHITVKSIHFIFFSYIMFLELFVFSCIFQIHTNYNFVLLSSLLQHIHDSSIFMNCSYMFILKKSIIYFYLRDIQFTLFFTLNMRMLEHKISFFFLFHFSLFSLNKNK